MSIVTFSIQLSNVHVKRYFNSFFFFIDFAIKIDIEKREKKNIKSRDEINVLTIYVIFMYKNVVMEVANKPLIGSCKHTHTVRKFIFLRTFVRLDNYTYNIP